MAIGQEYYLLGGRFGCLNPFLIQVQPVCQFFDPAFQFFDPRDQLVPILDLRRRVIARIAARFYERMLIWRIQTQFLGFELRQFLLRLAQFFGDSWIGVWHLLPVLNRL